MRSTRRPQLVFVAFAVLLPLLGACATPVPGNPAPPPSGSPAGSPPGNLGGFFVVHCPLSHSSHDDSIVFPGQPGVSHLHDFFGATTANSESTPQTLAASPTTCSHRGDTAGYWSPSALMDGVPVPPPYQNEYWYDGG